MKFAKSAVTAALLTAMVSVDNTLAFHARPTMTRPMVSSTSSPSALFVTPEDLTNAMAKAHEEKIRAMKDIEDKKNAEIKVSNER